MTATLCAAWLCSVAVIVFWPTPVDRAGGGALRHGLKFLYAHGLPPFVTYGVVEFMANVVMFVPLGFFWFLLAPRQWRWWGPAVGCMLSAVVETTQLLVLPHRFATPLDVLANTLGVILGCIATWLTVRSRPGANN